MIAPRNAAQQQQARRESVCIRCGKRPMVPGRSRCAKCLAYARSYYKVSLAAEASQSK